MAHLSRPPRSSLSPRRPPVIPLPEPLRKARGIALELNGPDFYTVAQYMTDPSPVAHSRNACAAEQPLILLAVALLLSGCTTPLPPPEASSTAPAPEYEPAASNAAARPAGPLTVDAAIQRALACNGELEALRATLSVAVQRKRAATDITDPELEFAWGEQTVDGLRDRRGTEVIDSTQHGEQTSSSRTITTESTVENGVTPLSTSTSTESSDSDRTTSSRARQTRTTTTTGYATEDTDGYRIGVRLFVPNLWQMMPRLSARRAEIQAAQADLRAAEWRVTCEVRRLFNELAYLTGDMALAQELIRLNDEILATTRDRLAQRAAITTDLMTAMRRDLQARNELDTLSQRHATARRDLGLLLNLSLESMAITLPELKPPAFPADDLTKGLLEREALLRREDIAALHWRTVAAHAAYREARNIRLPWIKEVSANYRASESDTEGLDTSAGTSRESDTTRSSSTTEGQRVRTETYADGTVRDSTQTSVERDDSVSRSVDDERESGSTWIHDQSDSEEWQVGFAIDIPIFSWIRNHEHDVLRAEHALAGVLETDGLRTVRRELGDALDEWRESRRQLARYDSLVGPLIAEMQRAAAELDSTPGTMPDQAAAAKAQVIETRRFKLSACHRACQAAIGLELVLGGPLDTALAEGAGGARHQ